MTITFASKQIWAEQRCNMYYIVLTYYVLAMHIHTTTYIFMQVNARTALLSTEWYNQQLLLCCKSVRNGLEQQHTDNKLLLGVDQFVIGL